MSLRQTLPVADMLTDQGKYARQLCLPVFALLSVICDWMRLNV